MAPESARYLRDMLDAADATDEQVAGFDDDRFVQARVVRDAVTWNLCVIGEALSQLWKADVAVGRQVTDHRRIVGLRNQLIHGYGVIDHGVTWRIVADHLPVLRAELERLLAS